MKRNQLSFLNRSKAVCIFLLSILASLLFNVEVVLAHSPHDDILNLEISPTYAQDQTLFIIVRGNLLKSQDGGAHWTRILKGLDHKYGLSSLAISGQSKKTLFVSSLGDGVYKSEDEGTSWNKVNQGLKSLRIELISVAPDSDEIILAAGTDGGLYQTENGGKDWHQVVNSDKKVTAIAFIPESNNQIIIGDTQGILYSLKDKGKWEELFKMPNSDSIRDIAISPNFSADKTFFVGTKKRGIFKTVNWGQSFKEINEGVSDKSIFSLAISPNYKKDQTLYASTWNEGVFQSEDGGNSWQKYNKGLTKNHQADQLDYRRPHFSYLKIANTSSKDKTIFLAGFDGLFKSTNSGQSWKEMDTLSASLIQGVALSPNYQNDSTVAFTTYLGGAYLSKDGGDTWTAINKGLEEYRSRKYLARLFGIEFSPNYQIDNTLFSALWTHFLKSIDEGEHWSKITFFNKPWWQKIIQKSWWLNKFEIEKPMIAISANFTVDKTIYLASMTGKIFRSTDGGQNFSVIGNAGYPVNYLVISPNFGVDKTLYVATSGGIYKTVNGGFTWQSTSDNIDLMKSNWIQLAISPDYSVDQTVFAATTYGLLKSKDGGRNWQKISILAQDKNAYVEAIALSPNYHQDRTFIVSVRGIGMFKTADAGKSFTQVGNDLLASNHVLSHMDYFPIATTPIQFSPFYSSDQTIYGFSGTELFKSTNGGDTWETLTVPNAKVMNPITYYYARLTYSPIRRFLIASMAALLGYFLLGHLNLKKFSYRKLPLKIVGTFVAFIGTFIFLSTWTF